MRRLQDNTVVFPPFRSSIHHPLLFCLPFVLAPAPLSVARWLIHLPCASFLVSISSTFFSLIYKNLFLIHHPLFSSFLAPLIVPDTQSLHFYIPPSSFSCFFLFLVFHPPVVFPLSFPHFLPLFQSIYSLLHILWFSLYSCFLFTLPPKLTILLSHPSLICHFLLLLSSSLLPVLIYNHNSITLALNSAPSLTSPSWQWLLLSFEDVISCAAPAGFYFFKIKNQISDAVQISLFKHGSFYWIV